MAPVETRLAVIIPVLNEGAALPALLGDLSALSNPHEILISDGGSTDATIHLAQAAGARVITGSRGRGAQMAAAARATRAEVLCFLHADTRLTAAACRVLDDLASRPLDAVWAFRLEIDAPGWGYRLIELGANLRSRILNLPYGDQGLVVGREAYEGAGGFLSLPLMEDVTFIRALSRRLPVRLLPVVVRVSPRRWQREGLIARTVTNWMLLAAWMLGASPQRLAEWYRPESPRGS